MSKKVKFFKKNRKPLKINKNLSVFLKISGKMLKMAKHPKTPKNQQKKLKNTVKPENTKIPRNP